jgi:hypothetical protein
MGDLLFEAAVVGRESGERIGGGLGVALSGRDGVDAALRLRRDSRFVGGLCRRDLRAVVFGAQRDAAAERDGRHNDEAAD